jgi:flagella basal body P-ring formation protein FlgA
MNEVTFESARLAAATGVGGVGDLRAERANFLPSLRDLGSRGGLPSVETLGYSRESLRDKEQTQMAIDGGLWPLVAMSRSLFAGLAVLASLILGQWPIKAADGPGQATVAPGVTNAPATPAQPRFRKLEEVEVRELLVQALKRQREDGGADWELTFTRPWAAITVADGPLTAELLEPATDRITSSSIFRFEIHSGHNVLGSWQAPVRVRLLREVMIAHANLQRGETLSSADPTRERRDGLVLRQVVTDLPADPGAYELTETVPVGAPLTSHAVRLKPIVVRGQLADAVVQDGAMMISLKVEVLEEGVPGQVVRVRNPQSRRELRGKVQDEKTIAIRL